MRIFSLHHMERIRDRIERLYGKARAPRLMERFCLLASRYDLDDEKRVPAWDERDSILITYGDMLQSEGEPPLSVLRRFLTAHLQDAIRSVHLLPFFPASADDGYAVIDHRAVNETLGSWDQVRGIGEDFGLMVDLVMNHASSNSPWFRYFQSGVAPAREYFIEVDPKVTDLSAVHRPVDGPLLASVQTPQGEKWVWTTFGADQIDCNFSNPDILFEFLDILLLYVGYGARIIRLDSVAYLWKQPGTSCIDLPETHEIVKLLRDVLEMLAPNTLLLAENNLPNQQYTCYLGDGDEANLVYQHTLPFLLLHALYSETTRYLSQWAASLPILPSGCSFVNYTASEGGISLSPADGLVPESGIREVAEAVRRRGGHVSTRVDQGPSELLEELNISYFEALSDPDHAQSDQHVARFLCSQAVMLSLKGIPAVYFHSLTATGSDDQGFKQTGRLRSINRSRWQEQELQRLLEDSESINARVFHPLVRLLRIRAQHRAFHPDGTQQVLALEDGLFGVERRSPDRTETVLAINNLSAGPRRLTFRDLRETLSEGAGTGPWYELVADQQVDIGTGGFLNMAPYQTRWLLLDPGSLYKREEAHE